MSNLLSLSDFAKCNHTIEELQNAASRRLGLYGLIVVNNTDGLQNDEYVVEQTLFVPDGKESGHHIVVTRHKADLLIGKFDVYKVSVIKHK